jgi:ribonuclease P protein component
VTAASRRLSGRARFAAVRSWRATCTSGGVTVHGAPNGSDQTRFGLATPGVRGAVVRNRVRRRLRAALAAPVERVSGLDLVVRAGAGAATCSFSVLAADAERAVSGAAAIVARRTAVQG